MRIEISAYSLRFKNCTDIILKMCEEITGILYYYRLKFEMIMISCLMFL